MRPRFALRDFPVTVVASDAMHTRSIQQRLFCLLEEGIDETHERLLLIGGGCVIQLAPSTSADVRLVSPLLVSLPKFPTCRAT